VDILRSRATRVKCLIIVLDQEEVHRGLDLFASANLKLQASPSLIINILIFPFHSFVNDFLQMSWDMSMLNVSATLNVFRVLARPGLCLPHATISTFNDLPVPLNKAFEKYGKANIRAVVLDKDDCFARPNDNEVYKPYRVRRRVS